MENHLDSKDIRLPSRVLLQVACIFLHASDPLKRGSKMATFSRDKKKEIYCACLQRQTAFHQCDQ